MRWLVAACLLLASCSSKSSSNILPENKMKQIVFDMIRVDEYVSSYLVKDSSINLQKERLNLYNKVFALHNTSKDQFYNSFKYYQQHPDQQKVMFDSLAKWRPPLLDKPKAPLLTDTLK